MKSNIRKQIRKQIRKVLQEAYEQGDVAVSRQLGRGAFSNFSNIENETIPGYSNSSDKNNKNTTTKKLIPKSNGELDVDVLINQAETKYYDATGVKEYYKKNHSNTINLIEKQATVEKSPDLDKMFKNVTNDEKKIYEENYEKASKAAASVKSNIQGDKDTKDALYTASNLCQIPLYTLYTLAAIESNGKQNATSPSGNHFGLFQFGDDAARGAGFSGTSDIYKSSDNGYKYKLNNSVAACNFMKANHSSGISKDIGLSTYSAYLMHQQGAAGSSTIYKNFKNNNSDLIDNQSSNVSSIEVDNLTIDTNRKWMIGWLGRVKGFEDAFSGVSEGRIRYPGESVYDIDNQEEFQSSGNSASWADKLGNSLKRYPNFDSVKNKGYLGGINNYRAGIDPRKGDHDQAFFEELEKEFGIENVVTLNREAEEASKAAEAAGLNVLYYPIGTASNLNDQQLNDIFYLLDQGNTLVHCTHGADRTGEVIGRYYVERNIMGVEEAKKDHAKYQGKSLDKYKQNFEFIEQGK